MVLPVAILISKELHLAFVILMSPVEVSTFKSPISFESLICRVRRSHSGVFIRV